MEYGQQDWCETAIDGFEIRVSGTVVATRVLGWEGVVPRRLASTLVPALMPAPRTGPGVPDTAAE